MIRLRYLLLAVVLLGLMPWALDGFPALSCVIPTVDCPEGSDATDSNDKTAKPRAEPDALRPSPIDPQRTKDVASLRVESAPTIETATRALAAPDSASAAPCCAGDAQAAAPPREFSFTATRGFGGVVTLTWRMAKETGVEYYLLDRKLSSDPDDAFERNIGFRAADGSGEYSSIDAPTPEAYTYRLRTLAMGDPNDGGRTLGTAEVAADYAVGLTVGDFALHSASGLVSVDWTAAQEVGVVNYVIDRKLDGAASYDIGVRIGYPQGDGTPYSVVDDPPVAGAYTYRLRATLSNGTDRILAEGGVTL